MIIYILAAIGVVTVVVYLIKWDENRRDEIEDEKKNISEIVEYGDKSNELWWKYQHSLINKQPICTEKEIYKNLKEILAEPKEKEIVNKNIKIEAELKIKKDQIIKEHRIAKRKAYYLYHELIFEVFDTNRELGLNELVNRISDNKNVDDKAAMTMIDDCKIFLIEKCRWNNNFKIVDEVMENIFDSDEDIFTHKDWLLKRNKILSDKSNDELKYELLRDTDKTLWKEIYWNSKSK